MALKRVSVHVEAGDLAVIKEAAAREGIPAAEIIREGVHLAAMSRRVWDEPFFSSTHRPVDRKDSPPPQSADPAGTTQRVG
ncbi:ribbon-helix-helix protein, CopG family [Kitasatospora purpeofusca]|uniref:ribbon-helix-helix protein, CopG family n=1 Tax=Kitasatospora purpeofusca TaxID=67352 RepID=UPI0033E68E40